MSNLLKLDKKYIRLTDKQAIVVIKSILLCTINKIAVQNAKLITHKLHISTRVLKHAYDK